MPAPSVLRQNALSDADLVADCRQRISQARLDLPALADEGVTAAGLNDFEQATTDFEEMPSDEALEYSRVALRQTRDAALAAGRDALRAVLKPVSRAYGDTSPQLKRFGASRLGDASVADVLNLLTDAETTATPYLTDPKTMAEGFTQARLNKLQPTHDTLRDTQKAFLDADQLRQEGTQARVLAYNALDTQCAKLCARGSDHFATLDAAKADAYVRNPSPAAGSAAPAAPVAP